MSLTVYTTAYLAEIFRAAFRAVAPDNIEAAHAFGLSRSLIYRRIILPQVAITAAPVIGNQVITTIRDSALLMIITVQELTFAANFVSANISRPSRRSPPRSVSTCSCRSWSRRACAAWSG